MKLPMPVPLAVWLELVVGFPAMFQHTPRAVTEAPPLLVTVPPDEAVVLAMEDTLATVTVGVVGEVVKLIWLL